ncbi:MAG TPA: SMC-Scp complex subunit ScpB [Steroidobacteraceae bacterium]|nr:SMC-Scp complex subunit ScpB [Steroidobacteraceae bacterium]
MNESHIRNVIEAALLAAGKPLQPAELVDLFDEGSRPQLPDVHAALTALIAEYSNRGIELKETATGFRIQVRRELANEISRLWPERPPRYSRALLETLALIAYRQPITRAEIEAVRGVAVNQNILKTVIERNWVRVVGHRDVPGRPELLGTTRDFLDYFGLRSLDELPPLAELKAIGDIKVQFDLPDPGPIALASDASAVEGTAADASAAAAGAPASDVDNPSQEGGSTHDAVAEDTSAVATAAVEASATTKASATAPAGASAHDVAPDSTIAGDDSAEISTAHDAPVADNAAAETVTTAVEGAGAGVSGDEGAADNAAPKTTGRGSGRKKRRGKARGSDTALHEAEEFAASVDADLAAGDDDGSDEDELSAAGPDSTELVAGPRDIDD